MRFAIPVLLLMFGLVTFPFAQMGQQQAREAGSTRRPPFTLRAWILVAVVGTLATLAAAALQDGVLLPTGIAIVTEVVLTVGSALLFLHGRDAQQASDAA